MRVVVDVNHPGHVHFFKNFIWEMEKRGHEVLITASRKDITFELLNAYGFDYVDLGSYGKGIIRKFLNLFYLDLKMFFAVRSFNPDVFLGISSIRGAHVAWVTRKKSIIFTDTEHAWEQHVLFAPFASCIVTPSSFRKDFGKKQVRYEGFHELAYLHPNWFEPDPSVLDELGVSEGEPYTVVRFVSWDATHDYGQKGIRNRVKLVENLSHYGEVFITSEANVEPSLSKYVIKLSPEKIHSVLYYASLYVGEGGTMASEAALLGTPSVIISSLADSCGILLEEQKLGLLTCLSDEEELESILENLFSGDLKSRTILLNNPDVTNIIINFVSSLFDVK